MIKNIYVALALVLALSGCTRKVQVNVPPVQLQAPVAAPKIAGKFAAYIQSGGWELVSKGAERGQYACPAFDYESDLNSVYEATMRTMFSQTFENIEFAAKPLTPEQLKAQGYAGMIVLHQGNGEASFDVKSGFIRVSPRSKVELTTILAIVSEKGMVFQEGLTSSGEAEEDYTFMASCNDAPETIIKAVHASLKKLAEDVRTAVINNSARVKN